ncbi:MAG: DUF3488 and transglutaminase-like domain-containing protein [Phycisphaerales bacterium]
MKLVERFRLAALVLVLVATLAFCVSQRDVTLLLVTAPLTILSWYLTEGPKGRQLPRWLQNVLLVLLIGWTIKDILALAELSDAMTILGRFVLWLTLIKLYGRKTARDYAHVLALSAVLVMAGTLQSVEFSFALLVFIYAIVAVWTVLLYQLWAARERTSAQRDADTAAAIATFGPGAVAASLVPALQPAFGRSVVRQFRFIAAIALVLGALLSTAVFLIFPRELADLARRDTRFGTRQSGFNGEVRLFTNDRISESRREVFTVQLRDGRGDITRFVGPLYLRGAVLSRYNPDTGRWSRAREGTGSRNVETIPRRDRDPNAAEPFSPLASTPIDTRFQTYTQRVTMRSLASEVIFSVWAPIAIACDDGRIFEFSPLSLLIRDTGADRISRLSSYELKVQPFPTEATIEALMGGHFTPQRDVRFPLPEIVELAKSTLAQLKISDLPDAASIEVDPAKRWVRNKLIARAMTEWLQSSAFTYTTDLGSFVRIRDEDPIVSFLTRYRFGHCEYFASALVAMCQSLGIESRLVTGYIAIEYDDTLQQYIVRESNAHAWAEVRVGDYAWLTLDPTPQTELAARQERNRSWADRWRWAWDRLEFLWNSQVVSFDSSTQATLADRFGSAWQQQLRELLDAAREQAKAINDYFRFGPAGYLWMGLVAVAGVLAVMAFVSVRRRRRRLRAATGVRGTDGGSRRVLRQVDFWLDAMDTLERHDAAKPAARSPMQHVEALGRNRPGAARGFADIVDLYYRVRFAGESLDAAGRDKAKQLVRQLDDALRN